VVEGRCWVTEVLREEEESTGSEDGGNVSEVVARKNGMHTPILFALGVDPMDLQQNQMLLQAATGRQ
jgi:hypothetical protein